MKTDFLYTFIQAMDEAETRYCIRKLRHNPEHNKRGYITMSNAFRSMKKFDPVGLALAVKGLPVAKHLAVEKTRLYRILLMHLSAYRESKKQNNDPQMRLREATLLFEMGLNDAAIEAGEKGLKAAMWQEDLVSELSLRDLIRKIYKLMAEKQHIAKRTENEYALVMAGKKLAKLTRYYQLNDRMFDYLRNYRVSDSDAVQRGIEELMASPELSDRNMADSLPSQIRFYSIHQMYHSQRNEIDKTIEMTKRNIALWEQRPERIKNDPSEYLSNISNLVGKLSISGQTDEALSYLSKLDALSVRGRRNQIMYFESVELQFQLFHLNRGMIKEVLEREQEVAKGLKRYNEGITDSKHLTLLYNFGVAHMLMNHSDSAIKYFNRIRELGILPVRQDLQGVGRLLRLLLISEKTEEFNLELYLRNSKPFFRETDRGYALEELVYGWLEDYSKLDHQKDLKASLQHFTVLLAPLVSKKILGAEEMWIWATAKVQEELPLNVFKRQLSKS